jgi:hypothetical protein
VQGKTVSFPSHSSRLALLVMMLLVLSSPRLLVALATLVSWLEWDKRILMLVMKLNPSVVS